MRPEIIEFTDRMPVRAFVRGGCQYPYHWHDTLEILLVLKGSVHISLGDEYHLLRENDVAVVNIGELHRIMKSHDDNELLFVHINDRFCRSSLPDSRYLFLYCCSAYHEAQTPEKYMTLKKHISRLITALTESPNGENKKDIENILAAMLSYISYNFDFLRWGFGTSPFDEKIVKRLRQIAEQASGDSEVRLRLKELAVDAGVSLQHLSYDIKKKFGLTFLELLYYSRCAHAAKLLLSTGERIVDIAFACGFSDAKYLIKYFKQYFRYTPSEFRKMHRANGDDPASQAQYHDCLLSNAIGTGIAETQ